MSNDRPSLHFSGANTINGVIPLIIEPLQMLCKSLYWYSGNCLCPRNLPNNGITFVDDNYPIHRAGTVRHWKRENILQEYSRPAHSPDLNLSEVVWAYMERQLHCMVLDHDNFEKACIFGTTLPLNFFKSCTSQSVLEESRIPNKYWNKLVKFLFLFFHFKIHFSPAQTFVRTV